MLDVGFSKADEAAGRAFHMGTSDRAAPSCQLGPHLFHLPITIDENKEIVDAFPRLGYKEQFIDIMCGLCALIPGTTYDNFVGDYGVKYELNSKGLGRKSLQRSDLRPVLLVFFPMQSARPSKMRIETDVDLSFLMEIYVPLKARFRLFPVQNH